MYSQDCCSRKTDEKEAKDALLFGPLLDLLNGRNRSIPS